MQELTKLNLMSINSINKKLNIIDNFQFLIFPLDSSVENLSKCDFKYLR